MKTEGKRSVGAALGVALAVLGASTRAEASDAAAAEALFGEAKKLVAEGKYAEACPKFAESNRLDRGAGTLIHLGNCYEKNRQSASAWATYKEAAGAAQAQGRKDWEKLATQRALALESKLAHLTVKVDQGNVGVTVTRDGSVVSSAAWGFPIPVDVGTHDVEASAPGRAPFKASAVVTRDGESVEVTVPRLEAAPAPGSSSATVSNGSSAPEPPAPPMSEGADGSGQRTLALVVGGAGVLALGVGAVTGLMAMSENGRATEVCPNDGACPDRAAVDASESARPLALVSTVGFVGGAVLVATGATLYFTAPSRTKTPAVGLSPSAGPSGAGLTLRGAF